MKRTAIPHDPGAPTQAELAEAVREACRRAAIEAWEEARIVGLCTEGAWEAAIGAICALDLSTVVPRPAPDDDAG